MGSSERKRKRDSEDGDTSLEQPKKVQVATTDNPGVDDNPKPHREKKSATGEVRQKRSERKKKKNMVAQQNAVAKQNMNPSSTDDLAAGQDFVSLDDSQPKAAAPAPAPATTFFQRRERRASKGSSPRSIRKQQHAAKVAAALIEEGIIEPSASGEIDGAAATEAGQTGGKSRYIVFVGNLPYDATTEQIEAHFVKLQPSSVRHSTDKTTGKSKGFAFLEFSNYDRMKTCLQSYHHSIFDPNATAQRNGEVIQAVGRHRKTRGRKLNVEMTAGGGGSKSDERKSKIQARNKKLTERREHMKLKLAKKRADSERSKKLRAEKEAREGRRTGANAETVAVDTDSRGAIHPSRMARVQG